MQGNISFQAWQSIFLRGICVGGSYVSKMPSINEWLECISKKRELRRPLDESNIKLFFTATIPKAMDQFLYLDYIRNYNEGQLLIQFFELVVNSLQSVSNYVNSDFITSITQMFDRNCKFYLRNKSLKIYDKIIDRFSQQNDILNSVLRSITEDSKLNFGDFFSLLISIYYEIYKSDLNAYKKIDSSNNLINCFINFMDSNQYSCFFADKENSEKLLKSFKSLLELTNCSKNFDDDITQQLFNLFLKTITNKNIEVQKFSASCLSILTQYPKQAKILCNQNSIIDALILINVDQNVLKELIPFIQFQIEQQIINISELQKFWNFCSESSKLDKNETVLNLFSFALKCINDLNEIKQFLFSIKIDSLFYINLLSKLISEFQNYNNKISMRCAKYLLNSSYKEKYSQKCLIQVINSKLNNTIYGFLLSQLARTINEDVDIDYVCTLIERIFQASTDPIQLFKSEESSINHFIKYYGEQNPRMTKVLFNLHISTGTKPSRQIIDGMIKSDQSEVWNYLKQLLDNNNYTNQSDYDDLFDLSEIESPEKVTVPYFDFLKALIFKYSQSSFIGKDGYSVVNSFQYSFQITKEQIRGLDTLLHVYQQSENVTIITNSKMFLLKILNGWKSNYSVEFLHFHIQELICQFQSENPLFELGVQKVDSLYRSLQLVYDYINEAESDRDPEDFDSPRHFYPLNYITINICVTEMWTIKKQYKIHIDKNKTVKNLKDRIADREGLKPDNVSFVDYQTSKYSLTLEKCNITNDSMIKVRLNSVKSNPNNQPPSLLFKNIQFNEVLFNLLDEVNFRINLLAWRILLILPNSQSTRVDNYIDFSDSFRMAKNDFQKLYLIQTFSENENIFNHSEIIESLLILSNRQVLKKDIIYLFSMKYDGERIGHAQEFSKSFIQFIQKEMNEDFIKVVFDVLKKLSQRNDIVIDDEIFIIFESLDDTFWELTYDFIVKVFSKNHLYQKLFELCESKILNGIEISQFSLFIIKKIIEKLDMPNIKILYQKLMKDSDLYCRLIIEKKNEKCQNDCKRNYLILSDLFEFISKIINKYPELVNGLSISVDDLFEIGFGNNSYLIEKSVLQILTIYIKYSKSEEIKNEIDSKINEMINHSSIKDWNFNPSIWTRKNPFVGLKNQGQTCFLNAIFQQLFHIFPVRYLVSTFEFNEEDELKTLQEVFIQMAYTSCSTVDTVNFVKTWHSSDHTLLNPNEQRDSVEFLLNLIDSFPKKILKLFQGELTNFIQGIDVEFSHNTIELIPYLNLTVKNNNDIYSSFEDFIKDQELADYINEDDGSLINVKLYQKVTKLPPILVFQLKRFEYDPLKNLRRKINDHFEFPLHLDVEKICLMNNGYDNSNFLYDLHGIVIHSGCATSGHYISYIRKENDWWCFNDSSVSTISEKEVLNEAYGLGQASAYALFYTQRKFSSIEKNSDGVDRHISFADEFDYSAEIKSFNSIIERNKSFERDLALFEPDLIDFVQELDDPIANLTFFIRVLCHSRNSKKADSFISKLKEKIESNDNSIVFNLTNFLNENIDDIVNCYLNSYPDIYNANLTDIIFFCFNRLDEITTDPDSKNNITPNKKSFEFLNSFADKIMDHADCYEKIPSMLDLINKYISVHSHEAYKNGWLDKIEYMYDTLNDHKLGKGQKSSKNISFDNIFDVFKNYLQKKISKIDKMKYKYSPVTYRYQYGCYSSNNYYSSWY